MASLRTNILTLFPRMTRKQRRQYRQNVAIRNKHALIIMCFPVMFIAKFMVNYLLPPKYFFDNNRILSMVNGTAGDAAWGGSYEVAAGLFQKINVFHLETMKDWSTCLGCIFTLFVMIVLVESDSPDLLQGLFTLATVGLLNIYIFNIGKDIIQFAFFFAVYMVLVIPIHHPWIKLAGSAAILYYESTFFRQYYVLIAALVIAVYIILTYFRRKKKLSWGSAFAIIGLLFLTIYAVMVASSVAMKDEYTTIIGLRAGYENTFGEDNGGNMTTAIQNKIPGDGLPIFMVNYIINIFRMLIPIELVSNGIFYIPFFLFQCAVTAYVINLLRQINVIEDPKIHVALCVFIGYVLASVLFEPDFGSWTRHEAATFPVLMALVLNPYQKVPLTNEERMLHGMQ
ncbi:hypothetical protein [Bifidobacterium leontopitheci]|uniref:Uncharacterized protein n=1 Tax=Bifidobacterium leontopitheci TaxID=2650774 RepID=A0A6I1GT08_9BIFI|nr:hypothetical protein [Bifidobacterium leontopitheci]KAB7789601.1 hypothetical protein F7D09_1897 [Bifidobacterium leontopitheci]